MFFINFCILIIFIGRTMFLSRALLGSNLICFCLLFCFFLHIVFARFICFFALNPITQIVSVFASDGGRYSRELCGFSMQTSPSSM